MVQNIGSAAVATLTDTGSTSRSTRLAGSATSRSSSFATGTYSGTTTPNSTGAATMDSKPLTGILGFVVGLLALI